MYLGLDFGTSGARACVLDAQQQVVHEDRFRYQNPALQTPDDWREALHQLLRRLPAEIASRLQRIAVNGTSATVLLCDADLQPVSMPLLYHDCRAADEARQLCSIAPSGHIACSASSGLAKFLWLTQHADLSQARFFMHQADWLSALLSGAGGVSDYHNALKTGYDAEKLCWPDWVSDLPHSHLLPEVLAPGDLIGAISGSISQHFNLNPACSVQAGTTDSTAAFLATGLHAPGAAATSLGSTLVLKILSPKRIEAAGPGVYSHRYGDMWLAGGASNAGAGILRQYFSDEDLIRLSAQIDPDTDSPLDYYPLPKPGERFPVNDPALQPRLTPRPADDAEFLKGLLQGISRIEAEGYAKLLELGAPPLLSVTTTGGGAKNSTWRKMRERLLHVPVEIAQHSEAAYGTALLAKQAGIIPQQNPI